MHEYSEENLLSQSTSHQLIDECISYINNKDCSYLAKEGIIVFYYSDTGRPQDCKWHKQTITETLRIIQALYLDHESAANLKYGHLISAFQEADRVYEYGANYNRHNVKGRVFNYIEHADYDMTEIIIQRVVVEVVQRQFPVLLLSEIESIITDLEIALDAESLFVDRRAKIENHFENNGYQVKTGSMRPLFGNRKLGAVVRIGSYPSELIEITPVMHTDIVNRIKKELK